MARSTANNYSEGAKRRAVNLVIGRGKSAAQVARDLKLSERLVQGWVREAKKKMHGVTPDSNLVEELKRLKKENIRLQKETETLKRAVTFFAKDQRDVKLLARLLSQLLSVSEEQRS